MPTLRLRDGRALHYHALGRGRTVVLLHGFAMHGGMWIPTVLPLAGRYRFVLPDLRGFGRSHRVPYAQKDVIANHADDVEDLLAALGEASVLLGGLSMGALTGLALASRGVFRRVAGYVHVDQAARIHNDAGYAHGLFGAAQTARFAELRALLDAADHHRDRPYDALPSALRAQFGVAFSAFVRAAVRPAWLKTMTAALRREQVAKLLFPVENWRAYLDCLRAYLDERYDFRDALRRTEVPVTVMVGESSEMYPAAGQLELARSIPGARLVRFAGVGHAVPLEAPVAFVRALARALDGAAG
jgi:pimeloyl-ACP methyl ester carboxylesterase